MVTLPTSLSAQPFPPFPACPGQYIHKDFWRWMPTVVTFQSRFPTARFNNPVIITWKQHSKWPLEGCCPAVWTQASINGPKTTFIFKFYYDTMHACLGWLMNALLGTKSDAFVYFLLRHMGHEDFKKATPRLQRTNDFLNNYYSMYSDSCAYYVQRPVLWCFSICIQDSTRHTIASIATFFFECSFTSQKP